MAKVPTLIAWRFWKLIGYTFLMVPVVGAIEIMREEFAMRRWPTLFGLFPTFGSHPLQASLYKYEFYNKTCLIKKHKQQIF